MFLAHAADNHVSDVYQLNLNPNHPIADRLDMFGNFGYYENSNYSQYRFGWPGLIYHVEPWLQLWGGLDAYYTDNDHAADQLELRPFAGVKFFVPNKAKIILFNYTRYEHRNFENLTTHDWTGYERIRSRFGAEVPLTSRAGAWETKTFYALADVEPFYRFDKNEWDPAASARRHWLHLERTDAAGDDLYRPVHAFGDRQSLEHSENVIELNLKIALARTFWNGCLIRGSKNVLAGGGGKMNQNYRNEPQFIPCPKASCGG